MPAPTWGESVCKECGKSFVYLRKRPRDKRRICDPCKVIVHKQKNAEAAAQYRKSGPLPPPGHTTNSSKLMHMSTEKFAETINRIASGDVTFSG